jgi:hypothetical protein
METNVAGMLNSSVDGLSGTLDDSGPPTGQARPVFQGILGRSRARIAIFIKGAGEPIYHGS